MERVISTLVILMVIVLSSCTERTDDLIGDGSSVILRFACNPSPVTSRADKWNDNYDIVNPDDIENTISTIDIVLCDESGNNPVCLPWTRDKKESNVFIATINSDNPCISTDESGNNIFSGRIVIMANSHLGDFPMESVPFRRNVIDMWGIPMWGTKLIESTTVDVGKVTHLGEVKLLRAMSKISVRLSDAMDEGYAISSATLTSCADYGNVVPKGAFYVAETGELSFDGCFNPVESFDKEACSLKRINDREYAGYVPEVSSPALNGMNIEVAMTYNGKKVELSNPIIHFVEYESRQPTDKAYNLVRNHCYEFVINSVSEDNEIEFTVCGLDNKSTDITFD